MKLPGCFDQRPFQTGVLPILTNCLCLKSDLPNISVWLNKTDGTRKACLHTSWLCARRVCFTWKDVPANPRFFTAPPFAWLQLLLLPHFLSVYEWTQTPQGLKGSQVFFFSCPELKADVSIPLGLFITCSFYKIDLASLPTLTSGE